MREKLTIHGGTPLKGTLEISGAKNSALPLLASSLLTEQRVHLTNVPDLKDVETMLSMVGELGKSTSGEAGEVSIAGKIDSNHAPADLVKKMRASFLVLAPLVARTGKAEVPIPGGCNIGTRPVDLHLKGLERLGVNIAQEDGKIVARADGLSGNDVFLNYPSVGATEQLIMAATMAKGETAIYNAAQEPEIRDLVNFLNQMGAEIRINGSIIRINGVEELDRTEYRVMSDRIAAGTYLIAGAATAGSVTVTGVDTSAVKPLSLKLKNAGITVREKDNSIKVASSERPENIEVITLPYPGFPTDLQAPITALLTLARGKSVVKETVFDSRFDHVPELNKMGADISMTNSNTLFVEGKTSLRGTEVEATDIRAGAALVIEGLAAEGKTTITGVKHLDRGYSNLVTNLRNLGAQLERHK
ncbi:UDP-N-acetylglucosamine 1-carboxyvinyltransferase [Candidatus Bipolaricaulota bacterium]|nr:UDP-N-acetylglucosamine 1-carboxyvinyltransferase [Candidatus Bipolaricaulota bacterium]